MSEVNENTTTVNDEDLNDDVEEEIDDAEVVTVPIDDTLTVSGEAADAKAVGDALALKADKSELSSSISVNGQTADNQGLILLDAEHIPMDDSAGAQTVAEAIAGGLNMSADKIPIEAGSTTMISDELVRLDEEKGGVKTVNGNAPDNAGDVNLERVDMAGDLESSSAQTSLQTYQIRTAGGAASISNGSAWLMSVRGNSVKTGVVAEVLTATPSNTDLEVAINADTFKAEVTSSTTLTLTFNGTSWSSNLATLGITVTGTPVANDTITVVYVKANRGTITNADPDEFISTGWNLYNHTTQMARVVNYSDEYGYRIDGTYTTLKFAETPSGAQTSLTVTNGLISGFPADWTDGYILVTGGNNTNTAIYATWSDWISGCGQTFAVYAESTVDISAIMSTYFENGLLCAGGVYDEINLNVGQAISRVERMAYSDANLATAAATGRPYDYDENNIYLARTASDIAQNTHAVTVSGLYTVNDHGLEMFDGGTVGVTARTTYGANLKNKLERDVLTVSQQTLSSTQQAQVRTNIGACDAQISFGDSTKTISQALTAGWTTLIPNDSKPHLVCVDTLVGPYHGFLTRYNDSYGSGLLTTTAVSTTVDGLVCKALLLDGFVTVGIVAQETNTPTVIKAGMVETNNSFTYLPPSSAEISLILAQYGADCVMYSVFRASSTNAAAAEIKAKSGITVTASNGTITVSNTTGNTWRYRIIKIPLV